MRLARDIVHALRGMRRHSLLTTVAVLALALGSGLGSAMFSVVSGWLLRPLPFEDADRLVLIWEDDVESPQRYGYSSNALFEELRQTTHSFETLSALRSTGKTPTALKIPSPLVRQVTASYFPMLGVEPMLGRTFLLEEDQPGGPLRVILSHSFWRHHLGGDLSIVGKILELDNEPYEVIGVLGSEYHSPIEREPPQLWVPLALDLGQLDAADRRHLIYGRLAQGISLEQARLELKRVTTEMRARFPNSHTGREVKVERVQEVLVSSLRPALLMLSAAVLFVLLIASGNVVNLLMARILSRRQEMAVRAAMGAGRGGLLRQLLVENLLLALLGAALGLAFAGAVLQLLTAMIPPEPGLPWFGLVDIDISVVLFTLGIAMVLGVGFALAQTFEAFSRTQISSMLRHAGNRSTAGRGHSVVRGLLVVLEIAVSLALVIGATLMLQSFRQTQALQPGFETQNVLTLRTALHGEEYTLGGERTAYFHRAIETIQALPGVEAAAATSRPPPSAPLAKVDFTIQGKAAAEPGFEPKTLTLTVTPGFFTTLRIPLLAGRLLSEHDRSDTEPVVVVSQLLADRYFGGQDPVDRVVQLDDGGESFHRIVGVVGDVRTVGLPPDPEPTLYLPHAQNPEGVMSYVVRTHRKAQTLAPDVVQAVASLDPLMPIYRVTTIEETIASVDWQPRFSLRLLSLFAFVALFLAAAGIYGVMAFFVSERRQELGIRIALGARTGDVLRSALRDGLILVAFGIGLGLLLSLSMARLLETQLYGVNATNPTTYGALAVFVALIALAASGFAASKALRIDPALTMRQESSS